jgi:dTDP-glucose 4,6-dehydratase
VSTDEVYGPVGPGETSDEHAPYRPSSPYAASKAGADHLVRAWGRTYGLPVLVTACGNNFGPFQYPEKLIPLMILSALRDLPLPIYGDGMQVRDWIHVDDHNLGVWAAIDRGVSGETYLLSARTERTNFEIVQMLLELFNKPSDFIEFVDDRPGHDLRYALDPSEAEVLLDWRAKKTDLKAELQTVVEFYLSQNRGK